MYGCSEQSVGARDADRRVVHSQFGGAAERAFSLLTFGYVRGCADVCARGHDPGGADAQVQVYNQHKVGPKSREKLTRKVSLSAKKSTHSHSCPIVSRDNCR